MKTTAAEETRGEIASLEAENAALKAAIDKERASMMTVIQRYHLRESKLEESIGAFERRRTFLEVQP